MIRLLLRLLGIKDYEICQSCETLKGQLALANAEKKELTETLLRMLNPKVVEQVEVHPSQVKPSLAIWSRRQAALEQADRERATVLARSTFKVDKSDPAAVEALEKEVGLLEEKG